MQTASNWIIVALGFFMSFNVMASPSNLGSFNKITTAFYERDVSDNGHKTSSDFTKHDIGSRKKKSHFSASTGKSPVIIKAPEISGDSAAIALALLAGILLLVHERYNTPRT